MKKTKIVIPALGLLLLSTAASVTGTVAWFSANTSVNVTGMTVSTKVSGNLLICSTNIEADYLAADLQQTKNGKVEPVSTVDGINWFYTKDKVNGLGRSAAESVFQQVDTTDLAAFSTYYDVGETVVPYVDYAFYLKATTATASQKVAITKCNFLYNNAALGENDLAWRVAIYAQEVTVGAAVTSDGALKSILSRSGAAYFDDKAVASISGAGIASFGAVSNPNAEAVIGTIDNANSTKYYKVVARVFLEGQDTKCLNETYVSLTANYSLTLTCALGDASGTSAVTGVTNIGSVVSGS